MGFTHGVDNLESSNFLMCFYKVQYYFVHLHLKVEFFAILQSWLFVQLVMFQGKISAVFYSCSGMVYRRYYFFYT